MQHPDEGLIHAWLDGELDAEESARVERLVAEDATWAAAAAEARGLVAASARILRALDEVPGDVIPRPGGAAASDSPRVTPGVAGRGRVLRPWMKVAAGVVLVVGVWSAIPGGFSAPAPASAPETALLATSEQTPEPTAQSTPQSTPKSTPQPTSADSPPRGATKVATAGSADREASRERDRQDALRDVVVTGVTSSAAGSTGATSEERSAERSAERVAERSVAERLNRSRAETAGLGGVAPVAAPTSAAPAALTAAPRAALSSQRDASGPPTADAVDAPRLIGCWRTMTTALADSVLVSPQIVRQSGDTLVIAISARGAAATVLRQGEAVLRGTAVDAAGKATAFRGVRVACPRGR